jgi:uncharacterized protein (TIGR02246 family)
MPATTPEQLHVLFEEALNSGSVEGVLDLYEDDATLMQANGTAVTGKAAIKEALLGFFAMKPTLRMETGTVLHGGLNLAMMEARWTLDGEGPGGIKMRLTGTAHEVVRRHQNGSWLYVIDDPGMGK